MALRAALGAARRASHWSHAPAASTSWRKLARRRSRPRHLARIASLYLSKVEAEIRGAPARATAGGSPGPQPSHRRGFPAVVAREARPGEPEEQAGRGDPI